MRVKGIMTMVIRTAKIVIVGFLVIGMVYSMTNGMVKDYLEDTMGAVVSKAEEMSNVSKVSHASDPIKNIHWGEAYVGFSFASECYLKIYFYEDGSIVPDLYNIYGNLVAENFFGAEAGSHKYEIQSDGLVHITHIQGSGAQMNGYFSIDGSIYYSEYSEGISCAFWESKQKTKMSDVIGHTYTYTSEYGDGTCELIVEKNKLTMRIYDASGKLEGEEILNENEFTLSEGDIGVYLYSENELIGLFYNQGTEFIMDGDLIFLRN